MFARLSIPLSLHQIEYPRDCTGPSLPVRCLDLKLFRRGQGVLFRFPRILGLAPFPIQQSRNLQPLQRAPAAATLGSP